MIIPPHFHHITFTKNSTVWSNAFCSLYDTINIERGEHMTILQETYTLYNGVKLPKIGLGTWQIPEGDTVYNTILTALKHGYRHIDTAEGYFNQVGVGRAVRDSGIPREEIFVTSKLQSHIKTYEGAKEAFEQTMKDLDLEYLDLYLIHAPWPWSNMGQNCDDGNVEAWKAMEEFYEAGRIKAIGVSNFEPKHLKHLIAHTKIVPHVNQIGYFIGLDQSETISYCNEHDIVVEAYSPLGIGYLLSNEDIARVAAKYNKTVAQICIRYLLQKGTAPLPKSTKEHRLIENAQVDFEIKEVDMEFLDTIEGDPRRWE
jgi:diketogulonate reductase-like aldo/keto reductase